MQAPQGFPKSLRVTDSEEFTRILKSGSYAADDVLVVNAKLARCHRADGQLVGRIGISIPNKTGNAVVRNHWKRLIREAFRLERSKLPVGYDFVVRPRKGAKGDFQSVRNSLVSLCQRATRSGSRGSGKQSSRSGNSSTKSQGSRYGRGRGDAK